MASSSNQAGELERMMLIVKQMMRSRDNDASVEKAVDRVVECWESETACAEEGSHNVLLLEDNLFEEM